jgi:pyridoxamine 5'-phosphate oxidase
MRELRSAPDLRRLGLTDAGIIPAILATGTHCMAAEQFLPEPLPDNPLPIFSSWFEDARRQALQPNPDAMVLATVGDECRPSARVVLCKQIAQDAGFIVFYTNYLSRKGRELTAHPRAGVVFHWDALHRQVRIEGPVVRSPPMESDSYFESRALASRIGAWASDQSQPLASRASLTAQVQAVETKFGVTTSTTTSTVPRPPHWGGHRLWIESIELWTEGPGRVHDRAVWQRELTKSDEFTFDAGKWRATRLNP